MKTQLCSSLAILCSSLIWAIAFIPTRYLGSQEIGVFSEIFIRYITPALLLLCLFPKHLYHLSLQTIIKAMLSGIILWIALVLAIYGVRAIEYGSMGLLLVTLYVLLVPFSTILVNKKKPSTRLLLCAGSCFSGLSLLVVGQPLGTPNIGTLLCLLTSIFYTAYFLIINTILNERISPFALHFYQSLALVFLSIPCMIFIEDTSLITILKRSTNLTPLILALLFTGLCAGFLAYQCLFYGQKNLTPTLVVILLSTKNVFGAIFDILFFNVSMTTLQYTAYTIVVLTTAIASLPVSQKSITL